MTISNRQIKLSLLDKIVSGVSPEAGLKRLRAKVVISAFTGENGYITPSGGKRFTRDWHPSGETADQDILPKHSSIRAASRDLYMNNPVAGAIISRKATNSVGWGLVLQSRVDRDLLRKSLKWDDDQFDEVESQIEREFELWSETPNCDASRHFWFNDMQHHAFFNTLLSGDVFVGLPFIERQGSPIPLCISILEGDSVSNPNLTIDTGKIAGGIEVDDNGAEIAYHVRKPSLLAQHLGPSYSDKWQRIEAEDPTGRPQMLHLYFKERPGQRRGVSDLAPLFHELKQITRLSKAELDAAVINAFFTVFIKSKSPTVSGLSEGYVPDITGRGESSIIEDRPGSEKLYEMGSGSIVDMEPDEEIDVADPKRPNVKFEPFFNAIVRQIGARVDVPYEVLMLNFTNSYSASRGAILEAWKKFRTGRVWLVRYFNTPIYQEVITEAVLRGRLNLPGFLEDPLYKKAWLCARWNGIGQGQLDPRKETEAYCKQIDYVLTTREDIHAKLNEDGISDWEGTMNRAAREKALLVKHDLPIYIQKSTNTQELSESISEGNSQSDEDTDLDDTNIEDSDTDDTNEE